MLDELTQAAAFDSVSAGNLHHRRLQFMADRRDQKMEEKVAYYSEQGLNQQ